MEYRPCDREIVKQIIPASNVVAVFKNSDGSLEEQPVICWALKDIFDDDDGTVYQSIVGMIILDSHPDDEEDIGAPSYLAEVITPGEVSGKFLRYLHATP